MNSNSLYKNIEHYILPITLIFVLSLSRLIPHPPNFTPIITVAIISGYFFKNVYLSAMVLIISMLIGDLFIGFYTNMIFVYISLLFITIIFFKAVKKMNSKNLIIFAFLGSLVFFLISNFGVWIFANMYEKNLNGLMQCYLMAIPFFKNTLFSSIIFTYISYMTSCYFKFSLKFR
jgi:hypothetical protein